MANETAIVEKITTDVFRRLASKAEYEAFFKAKLKKYGVKSPAELGDKKDEFFDEIEKSWTKDKD